MIEVDILNHEFENKLPYWLAPAIRGCRNRMAIRAKHRARYLAALKKPIAKDEFKESDHPREAEKHDTKRPGEFAPKSMGPEDGRISPRLPTAVKSKEKSAGGVLQIDYDSLKRDPDLFKNYIDKFRKYPTLKGSTLTAGKTGEVSEKVINHLRDNLLFLHDSVDEKLRAKTMRWYDGAHKIVEEQATATGLPMTSIAGAYAALSPQMLWDKNVALGDAVIDDYMNHRKDKWTSEMDKRADVLAEKDSNALRPTLGPYLKLARGKTLGECLTLSPPEARAAVAGMWIRIHNEVKPDRSFSNISPEGERLAGRLGDGGKFKNSDGATNTTLTWPTSDMLANAVLCLQSSGDPEEISKFLGERHKVRSFYSNIIAPNSTAGDVTIDTHAVGAAMLMPASGNDVEVAHNFGNSTTPAEMKEYGGSSKSSVLGIRGTYPIYAEAYRRAAAMRGILPRQLQSITWEAQRKLFPEEFKTTKSKAGRANREAVQKLWQSFSASHGKMTADAARRKIREYALANGGSLAK